MGGRFSVVFPDPMSPCSLSFGKFYNLGWNIRNSIHYSLLEDGWSAIRLITQKDGGNFACLNSSLWLPAPVIRHWACVWTIQSIQTQAEDGITDINSCYGALPGGSDGKESPCNAGDTGLILELERSPGEGNENSLQYSCLVNSMDRGVRHDWVINTCTKEGKLVFVFNKAESLKVIWEAPGSQFLVFHLVVLTVHQLGGSWVPDALDSVHILLIVTVILSVC